MLPALMLAAFLVYQPAWKGGLLWDDDGHITAPELQSAHGLWRIWSEPGASQQYYPVTHTAFWIQHRLWGDSTQGYHLVSIALHALAAFLAFLILRQLAVPGAILAAVIFALHPVQVESVAWISELKNTLSCVSYLGALFAYLRFDQDRKSRVYVPALALFILALLSKTVTATLPAALLIIFWWQRGRLKWRYDVRPLIPFFAFGAAAGLFTVWMERGVIGARGAEFQFSVIERLLIAGRAFWFYLGKLFWPAHLTFIYPRWQIDHSAWWQYLFPAGAAVLIAGLWLLRKHSRAPLAALLFFGAALFPALGFLNVFSFRFSFVADHFQYIASLGIIALFSAGLAILSQRVKIAGRAAALAVLIIAAILGFSSWKYSHQYVDAPTLYRATIERNPSCWLAYLNLGKLELHNFAIREAMVDLTQALRIKPDLAEAHYDMGLAMQRLDRIDEAAAEYRQALKSKPDFPEAYNNLGIALQEMGRTGEAIPQYEMALRLNPGFAYAHNNLALALQRQGRVEEAIAHYQEALRLKPDYTEARRNLSRALLFLKLRKPK